MQTADMKHILLMFSSTVSEGRTSSRYFGTPPVNSNITLKWGMTSDNALYKWFTQAVGGSAAQEGTDIQREDLTINLLGEDGTTVRASWQVRQAWPCKYVAPDFNANASEVAFESIELAHEGLQRLT